VMFLSGTPSQWQISRSIRRNIRTYNYTPTGKPLS
jgi:hypothetical protein